jgi:hypothetical protein
MNARSLAAIAAAALAAGCASRAPNVVPDPPIAVEQPPATVPEPAPPPLPAGTVRYRCEGDRVLLVRLREDAAQVQGLPQGEQTLLLDAGGVTPQQRVFSNPGTRMEIGLGDRGREAVVQLLQPPAHELRCVAG